MRFRLTFLALLPGLAAAPAVLAQSDDPQLIFKKSTVFRLLSPDAKLAVYAIDDPGVDGVACHFTIPEIGVVKPENPPIVIITSNRTREIHDALKRRCLYHWVGYPDSAREIAILRAKAPRAPARLTAELVAFVQRLRKQDLFKSPGVAETLDWASALTELDAVALDPAQVSDTLGVLLKYQDDIAKIQGAKARELIDQARAESRLSEVG